VRKASVTFWAWIGSLIVHLIILAVLGVMNFSHAATREKNNRVPVAKVSRIERLINANQVMPKPKIKKITNKYFANNSSKLLAADKDFKIYRPNFQSLKSTMNSSIKADSILVADNVLSPPRVEFFGTCIEHRRICYVVDCSGSMRGMLSSVKKRLKESINRLQHDQYFCIIFFGGNEFFEFAGGKMLRATPNSKLNACDFIDTVSSAGVTNALDALGRAVKVRDVSGVSPSVIYFLTDGFELTDNPESICYEVRRLLEQFAPGTRINTIGFWPRQSDEAVLRKMAEQSGGEAVFLK
jgi:uncharacterized protein with von Willebrand factor type A (vWA) domain